MWLTKCNSTIIFISCDRNTLVVCLYFSMCRNKNQCVNLITSWWIEWKKTRTRTIIPTIYKLQSQSKTHSNKSIITIKTKPTNTSTLPSKILIEKNSNRFCVLFFLCLFEKLGKEERIRVQWYSPIREERGGIYGKFFKCLNLC